MVNGLHLGLLVTDVVMPDMKGPELYRRLKESYPALKVLYMSGFTQNVIVHNGALNEGVNFIQKPFPVHDFARKVEEIIKSPEKIQSDPGREESKLPKSSVIYTIYKVRES
jgi:FixJ family two-component response regulator